MRLVRVGLETLAGKIVTLITKIDVFVSRTLKDPALLVRVQQLDLSLLRPASLTGHLFFGKVQGLSDLLPDFRIRCRQVD